MKFQPDIGPLTASPFNIITFSTAVSSRLPFSLKRYEIRVSWFLVLLIHGYYMSNYHVGRTSDFTVRKLIILHGKRFIMKRNHVFSRCCVFPFTCNSVIPVPIYKSVIPIALIEYIVYRKSIYIVKCIRLCQSFPKYGLTAFRVTLNTDGLFDSLGKDCVSLEIKPSSS